ncbi:tetratricopeptide repeat protein [Pasteurella sp. PK-2025]|uniref:nSTAND1 domain-containing NTPase n=1 Tax=Pasteurella sp. PK-2025 TaxID=3413133 RepID=UPI003C7439F8
MSQLFISHSSLDNAQSIALRDWLREQGWSLFLDLDPEHGIQVGEEWRKKLRDAIEECEAMILLMSEHWLASKYCLAEYHMAVTLNKPLFPLVIRPLTQQQIPHAILDKWNIGYLTLGYPTVKLHVQLPNGEASVVNFSQTGLESLKRGLTYSGLHPECFQWPPLSQYHRPPNPYKGLKPLEQEDAGILFGRDGAIKSFMAELQRLRTTTQTRVMIIQGASGSGKSSFLRAGILPRLIRHPQHFTVLPIVRPHDAVLSGEKGLIEALAQGSEHLKLGYSKAQLSQLIESLYQADNPDFNADVLTQLEQLLEAFIQANQPQTFSHATGSRSSPTLILPLDQAEELFTEQHEQTQVFLQLIAQLICRQKVDLLLLATIRTDAYAALQASPELEGIEQYPFSLPRIAKGAFQQIIEGPAKLLANTQKPLWVDPMLTDRLLKDLEQDGGKDALPLLAFTLERLYIDYAEDGKLELKEYLTFQDESTQQHSGLGGLRGAVNIAIEEALRNAQKDPRIPQDHQACMALLRRAFIPALASIDLKTHRPHRKVAYYDDIPEDVRPLIDCLVESRLLTKDYHASLSITQDKQRLPCYKRGITIELAHESILRQWQVLSEWLKEDIADLSLLEMLQVESLAWLNAGNDPEWLRLRGGRLQDAERLQQGKFHAYITETQQQYLNACRQRETDELNNVRELANSRAHALKRTKFGLALSSFLLSLSILALLFAFDKKQEAEQQTKNYQTELKRSRILLKEIGQAIQFLNFDVRDVFEQYVPTTKQSGIYAQIEQLRQHLEQYACHKELRQLRQIATSYVNQGSYTWRLGDFEGAKHYYQRAFDDFKHLLNQNPDNPKAQQDLSIAHEKLGNIAEAQHNLKLALKHYQAAFNIRQHVAKQYPQDPLFQHHLSIAYKKLGDIYHLRHRPQLALKHYQAALKIDQMLVNDKEVNDNNWRELSMSYHKLGQLMFSQSRYNKAFEYYQIAFELTQQRLAQDPANQKTLQDVSISYEHLGDVKQAQQDFRQAQAYYQKAIDIEQQQAKQDPHNSRLQRNLAVAYEKIADVIEKQHQPLQAEEYYQAAFNIFQKLADASPNNRQAQLNLGIAYDKLGNLALSQAQFIRAQHDYQHAFQIFDSLVKQSPKNKRMQRLLSMAHHKLGNLAQAQKEFDTAEKHYKSSFHIRYTHYLKRTDNPQAQQDLAISYESLGDIAHSKHYYTQANYYYQQALHFSEALLIQQPENQSLFEKTILLHQKLEQIYQHLKDDKRMKEHHETYIKLRASSEHFYPKPPEPPLPQADK